MWRSLLVPLLLLVLASPAIADTPAVCHRVWVNESTPMQPRALGLIVDTSISNAPQFSTYTLLLNTLLTAETTGALLYPFTDHQLLTWNYTVNNIQHYANLDIMRQALSVNIQFLNIRYYVENDPLMSHDDWFYMMQSLAAMVDSVGPYGFIMVLGDADQLCDANPAARVGEITHNTSSLLQYILKRQQDLFIKISYYGFTIPGDGNCQAYQKIPALDMIKLFTSSFGGEMYVPYYWYNLYATPEQMQMQMLSEMFNSTVYDAGYSCHCPAGQMVNVSYALCHVPTDVEVCTEQPLACVNGQCAKDPVTGNAVCMCLPGFTGTLCANNTNECSSAPCVNGDCHDQVNGYTCSCWPGWTGTLCDTDVNECATTNGGCLNGATCLNGANTVTCQCVAGYTDAHCGTDINECYSYPCQHGATCQDQLNAYTCQCAQGFTGTVCSTNINECATNNGGCLNGATCVDGDNSVTCLCVLGWIGLNCGTDYNECSSYPCQHGGTCQDQLNAYTCNCAQGWTGTNCDTNINECATSNGGCLNGATCVDGDNSVTCQCVPGYTDSNCGTNTNECNSSPCGSHGTCTDQVNAYTCSCKPGWTGTNCDTNVNECATSNGGCLNGATCVDGDNSVTCQCVPGYTGQYCGTDTNECASFPCSHGTCADQVNAYTCTCVAGWTGTNCDTNINECATNNGGCLNGATCVDGDNSVTCNCRTGWTGVHCETNINECAVNNGGCQNGATCVDGDNTVTCQCVDGYAGAYCGTSVNECYSMPCLHGTCHDLLNAYSCTCNSGWTGVNCDVDINECATNNGGCQNGATCVECGTSVYCNCVPGWTGSKCGSNVNECASVPCQHGTCQNQLNAYTCTCSTGWTGTNCDTNINECATNNGGCHNGATCYDGDNSVICQCAAGWSGTYCDTNINECKTNNGGCLNGATCTDGVNTVTCQCALGYSGPYCGTSNNECSSNPCGAHGWCEDKCNSYTCHCNQGWTGTTCNTNINECKTNNGGCLNGATCVDGDNSVTCQCAAGYSGQTCCTNTNECSSNPCGSHGTCADQVNGYTCSCNSGWTGVTCATNINECATNNGGCQNGATCVDGDNTVTCQCVPGFGGCKCESDINECSSVPCQHGTCLNQQNRFTCNCNQGWTGVQCTSNINECKTNNGGCHNGATCVDGDNTVTCQCAAGWIGTYCDTNINECATNNGGCLHNAQCIDGVNSVTCVCPPAYTGNKCQSDVNSCQSNPCVAGGTCVNSLGGYTCQYCSSNPSANACQNGGTCVSAVSGPTCQCLAGWEGSTCGTKHDNCQPVPCFNGGTCTDLGSPTSGSPYPQCPGYDPDAPLYKCTCPAGTAGYSCEININECASQPCKHGATCYDELNDYTCLCTPGYSGDNCDVMDNYCQPNPCVNGGTCANLVPGFKCTCAAGFNGTTCAETSVPSPVCVIPVPLKAELCSSSKTISAVVSGQQVAVKLAPYCYSGDYEWEITQKPWYVTVVNASVDNYGNAMFVLVPSLYLESPQPLTIVFSAVLRHSGCCLYGYCTGDKATIATSRTLIFTVYPLTGDGKPSAPANGVYEMDDTCKGVHVQGSMSSDVAKMASHGLHLLAHSAEALKLNCYPPVVISSSSSSSTGRASSTGKASSTGLARPLSSSSTGRAAPISSTAPAAPDCTHVNQTSATHNDDDIVEVHLPFKPNGTWSVLSVPCYVDLMDCSPQLTLDNLDDDDDDDSSLDVEIVYRYAVDLSNTCPDHSVQKLCYVFTTTKGAQTAWYCLTVPVAWGGSTNRCAPNPCLNGGTCSSTLTGYTCTCASAYTGLTCATAVSVPSSTGSAVSNGCVPPPPPLHVSTQGASVVMTVHQLVYVEMANVANWNWTQVHVPWVFTRRAYYINQTHTVFVFESTTMSQAENAWYTLQWQPVHIPNAAWTQQPSWFQIQASPIPLTPLYFNYAFAGRTLWNYNSGSQQWYSQGDTLEAQLRNAIVSQGRVWHIRQQPSFLTLQQCFPHIRLCDADSTLDVKPAVAPDLSVFRWVMSSSIPQSSGYTESLILDLVDPSSTTPITTWTIYVIVNK